MPQAAKLACRAATGLFLLAALGAGGCRKALPIPGLGSPASSPRSDALFLAESPAVVPEELGPELDAMGIRRLYAVAASLTGAGQVRAFPPPPSSISRPVVLVLM